MRITETVVDRQVLQRCMDCLDSLQGYLGDEIARLDEKSETCCPGNLPVLVGERFALNKLVAFLMPRICEHEDIEFGDVDEQGECKTCHAKCDWHIEYAYDEDTGKKIEDRVVNEWHYPTIEEVHDEQTRGLRIDY